jgi:glutamyl-tRNA reductase
MTSSLVLVGISHRSAPVEVRERLALTLEQAAALSRRLAADRGEAICLSTCNRTEVYAAAEEAERAERLVLEALSELSTLPTDHLHELTYRLRDDDVPLHAFRVAAGLDSLVPGEGEILGQVRDAFEHGAVGPLLDRMFRGAIHAGRRVRRETAIREVPASVAAAAAALAEQLFGELSACRVLLVGAGKTGDLAARSLAARGARIELVANRSPAKAKELASRYGGSAIALGEVAASLAEADVVVASTSARGYVVTRGDVEASLRARRGRPLFLIDIAVPRDIDPAAHDLDGCFVYDIDDLEAVVAESMPGRAGEAERAEAIAAAEAERFRRWRAARDVAPAIASLRARAETIRADELARARARLSDLSEAERAVVEALTARIVDKLLHVPTVRLKEAAASGGADTAAAAFRELFELDDDAAPGRDAGQ